MNDLMLVLHSTTYLIGGWLVGNPVLIVCGLALGLMVIWWPETA